MTPAGSCHVQDTLDRIVPEGHHYRHLDEGLDDMPAHVKAGSFFRLCLQTDAVECHCNPKLQAGMMLPESQPQIYRLTPGGAVLPHGAKLRYPHSARKACAGNMAR